MGMLWSGSSARMGLGRRLTGTRQSGFTLVELMVVIAIVGILASLAAPTLISYFQTASVRAAAQDIQAFLNQGRQLAVKTNQNVCVQITATSMRYRLGGCSGATWVGPGTDAAGNINAPDGITLTNTADPVFSNLGAAAPAASYTVAHSGYTLSVIVSASGRVTIGP